MKLTLRSRLQNFNSEKKIKYKFGLGNKKAKEKTLITFVDSDGLAFCVVLTFNEVNETFFLLQLSFVNCRLFFCNSIRAFFGDFYDVKNFQLSKMI